MSYPLEETVPHDQEEGFAGMETLDVAELAYHAKLVERVKWANQVQQEVAAINASFRSWGEHLHEKYRLGSGDTVTEDGTIARTPG